MLNICSKKELKEIEADNSARRQIIKNKIVAIGRLSRVFSILQKESESISELKRVSGSVRLPAGTLMLGAEGIQMGMFKIVNFRL